MGVVFVGLMRCFNSSVLMAICAILLLANCSQVSSQIANYSKYIPAQFSTQNYKNIPTKITVQKGDSLSVLAKKYRVKFSHLAAINNLRKPYKLSVGQSLKMPKPKIYKVQKGDFISKIAKRYGVNYKEIAALNGLRKPYKLSVGQDLKLPYAVNRSTAPKAEYVQKSKQKPAKKTSPKIKKKSNSKKRVTVRKYSKSKGSSKFIWPAKGKIILAYGASKDGEFNDGINISAREGAKIYASDAGSVVYVGNELKTYGNLLIIRHSGGWLTAYAHNKSFAVKNGDKVRKGQLIAYVGKTGNVQTPQLHFVIRKGRNAVDPLKYLAG